MRELKKYIPLVSAFEQTRELWDGFDAGQRRAAVLASLATFGRIGLRIGVERAFDNERFTRTQAALAHTVLDFADTVDGRIARSGNAVIPWGRVADPLADKVDFAIQDGARVHRHEMPASIAAVRIGRDVISTALRQYESAHPVNGQSRTAAAWAGKASTASRSASNRLGDLALNSPVARAAQVAPTAGLVASLASNARDFYRNRR